MSCRGVGNGIIITKSSLKKERKQEYFEHLE